MTSEATRLLLAWTAGDPQALDRLLPLVYDEMRRLARGYLARERPDHTLQTTGLVHEAYLRLVDRRKVDLRSRAQFRALAAQAMRRVLVDHARRKKAAKRAAAGQTTLDLDAAELARERPGDLDALDRALEDLSTLDSRQARVVEMRFFGGFTIEETGEALEISPATVKREWSMARAWLYQRLAGELG